MIWSQCMHAHVNVCEVALALCRTYWLFAEGGKIGLALFDHLSLQIAGRYIPAMAVNRRYITPEVGWLVGLRGGKRSA